MKIKTLTLLVPLLLSITPPAQCDPPAPLPLVNVASPDVGKLLTPQSGSEAQVTTAPSADPAAPGIVVTIQPGVSGYPGINIKPEGAPVWDLSKYGHVEARITNMGDKNLSLSLRVDNAGDWHEGPWNTESFSLKPATSGTISVIFGYSYQRKPGYALKSAEVANLLIFTTKSAEVQKFRIDSIVAAGETGEKPPVDPATLRTQPKDGVILGPGVTIDPAKQIDAKGGAQGTVSADGLKITLPAGKGDQTVALKPPIGRWDLRFVAEVRVKLKNTGNTPVTPSVQLTSNTGSGDVITAPSLAPGAESEIVVPFAAVVSARAQAVAKPGYFSTETGTGTKFGSDAASAIKISAAHEGEASLEVTSIIGDTPEAKLPDWLGKRPPVAGDWVQTFDDEFDGKEIDQKKWNIYGENFWDKRTHWSKDNLILGDGVVKQHFEKKHGYHNDDPKSMLGLSNPKTSESDYACGYLDTYGKWVQRYGYFEARVKLPVAPGLWPTFWLMPDRGVETGPQWKRQSTSDGGMEMDIMEHLTRWGPHRYNIANHWDGYGKEHKSVGNVFNYVLPDKDGFITVGLLWTPGQAVYYANGNEMFRVEDPRIGSQPANIIFETTTGGWDNNAVDDKQLPVDYVIDYVRVWQRKDLASSVDGYKSPAK
ncbi:MAG: family 16 glycosylhydrolase [Chthoniobacteraceae bacterium]